jgi:hypothetical protein
MGVKLCSLGGSDEDLQSASRDDNGKEQRTDSILSNAGNGGRENHSAPWIQIDRCYQRDLTANSAVGATPTRGLDYKSKMRGQTTMTTTTTKYATYLITPHHAGFDMYSAGPIGECWADENDLIEAFGADRHVDISEIFDQTPPRGRIYHSQHSSESDRIFCLTFHEADCGDVLHCDCRREFWGVATVESNKEDQDQE